MQDIKQVIVVRKDLHMRRGKEIAQGCHASMKAIMDMTEHGDDQILKCKYWHLYTPYDSPLDIWLNGIFTKICVSCDSEAELLKYYTLAKLNKIPCSLITDNGLTEFHNVPTNTCIAIGPYYSDKIDEITGHLKLL